MIQSFPEIVSFVAELSSVKVFTFFFFLKDSNRLMVSLCCLCLFSLSTFEPVDIFMEYDMNVLPLEATSIFLVFNFQQLVITPWQAHKFVA